MEKKDKKLYIVLGIFALVIVTTVASFAFFTYTRTGSTKTIITSGDIEFSYFDDKDNATLENAFPVADSVGAIDESGEYKFSVRMKASGNAKLAYNVYFVTNNDGTNNFTNDQIKYALLSSSEENRTYTYLNGTSEEKGNLISTLAGLNEGSSNGEGLALEDVEINNNEEHFYKLRIWISDEVNYSNTIDNQDEQLSNGKYNGYTYSLKVKVTSEATNTITIGNINLSKTGKMTTTVSDPNGLKAYAITESQTTPTDSEWINVEDTAKGDIKKIANVTSKDIEYKFTKEGTYFLHVKNKLDQYKKKTINVKKIEGIKINVENITWTSNKATVELSIDDNTNYIEYQINSTTGTWQRSGKKGENITISNLSPNQTLYARTNDGTTIGEEQIIKLDDKNAPYNVKVTATENISSTSLRLTGSASDDESGIKNYEYFIYKGEQLIKKSELTTNTYIAEGLTVDETYTIYVKAYDYSGNNTESAKIEHTKLVVYQWNEFNADVSNVYKMVSTNSSDCTLSFRASGYYVSNTNASSKFNSSTGCFDTSKFANNIEPMYYQSGYLYTTGERTTCAPRLYLTKENVKNSKADYNKGIYHFNCTIYSSELQSRTYTKTGTTPRRVVSSTKSDAYPENGGYGSYWYEKIN